MFSSEAILGLKVPSCLQCVLFHNDIRQLRECGPRYEEQALPNSEMHVNCKSQKKINKRKARNINAIYNQKL